MGKLFLEGPRGIGKTSLILQQLQQSSCKAVGFVSVRLLDDDGDTVGFAVHSCNGLQSTTMHYQDPAVDPNRIFLSGSNHMRRVHLSAFENIEEFLIGYQEADVVIMDELGGIELQLPSVYQIISTILTSHCRCIGTIKSIANYDGMKQRIDTSLKDSMAWELRSLLLQQEDARILELTEATKHEVEDAVKKFFLPL